VIPWSPLGGGILGGALAKAKDGRRAQDATAKKIEKHRAKLEQYEKFCKDLGEEPANIALAWLLSNKTVTAPIIGPRTKEQLDGSLRVLEIDMKPEILQRLDQIFPGPGGAAPEAYAW
jgi:aryl-alcohol dehydrogenase-like predicted oxidoreductase